jgi:DNA polymerase III delta prime subunit
VGCIAPHRTWCSQQRAELWLSFSQGPPGTGKTTSILALAHGLLGTNYREGVLELNASDDRCTTLQTRLSRLHRQMRQRQRWVQRCLAMPRKGTRGAAMGR